MNALDKRMVEETSRQMEVGIREYLEQLINERDRLYDVRFKAAETAVTAALAAQEKQTFASFAASEKAIVKAESAQSDYNARSNEFRGQLDDQAKRLISRVEVETMMKNVEEKIDRIDMDNRGLRETRSNLEGKSQEVTRSQDTKARDLATILTIIGLVIGLIAMAITLVIHK